jgi:hypothetical protein
MLEQKSLALWSPEPPGSDLAIVAALLDLFDQEMGALRQAAPSPREVPCES